MKRILCPLFLWLACLTFTSGALADASSFPDLACLLGTAYDMQQQNYAFSDTFTCDVYRWDYPVGWDPGDDERLAELAQTHCGWAWETGSVEGHDAFLLTGKGGETAILVSRFEGQLLALLPVGCEIVRVAAPAAAPVPVAAQTTGGHYEPVLQKVDCPSCRSGVCSVCNGSGIYRLYGEMVECEEHCISCDGLGYFWQETLVYVP